MPPLKELISFSTVRSRIIGIMDKRNNEATVIMEQMLIFLVSLNKVKKINAPHTQRIGEMKKIYPAMDETALPPLKWANKGSV